MKTLIVAAIVLISGCASVILTYVFADRPRLILISLVLLAIAILVALRSKEYTLRYLAALVLLPLIFDIPGTYFGLWSFRTPDLFGFPFWLPFFYGNIAVAGHYYVVRALKVK